MADVLDFEVRMKMAEEDIRKMNAQLRDIANNAEDTGERMDDAFTKVGKTIGAVFATSQLIDFGKQVVNVRKEIEAYEISFRTLLGSQDKADALFGSLREFAVKTPMQLGDLAKGAQTLLGFGIEADKIMPTLKQIGDISMGNADKFNSLTLAFAQMSSSGKLMGQDLLQMINAGFNPLSIISQKTGKSIGGLKKEMEQGAISADMIADAFKTATSEGGMFYGMLEKQSEGLQGALSNLQGAWEETLNSIGERTQGVVIAGLKGATTLVENYDKLISVILGVASAYGTYRTALLATVAIDQTKRFADNIRLIAMFRKELGLLKAAQQAFNLTAMKNPYILLASAIAGVGVALYSFISRTDEATKKQEEFNKALGERTSGTIGKIKTMSQEWTQLGDDLKAKEQYIIDNKSSFEELGVAINSVVEAENLLINNKDKFIEAQTAKIKAQLNQEKANELIAKQIENEAKIANLKANPYTKQVKDYTKDAVTTASGATLWSYKTVEDTERTSKEIKKLEDENKRLKQEIDDAIGQAIAETVTPADEKSNQNINEEIKKYTDNIRAFKKELADLRSGKTSSSNLLGDIEAVEKKIKDNEEALEKLRGKQEQTKPTSYIADVNEEAQRMEDENFQNRLRHEAELARVRGENLEEYYQKQQEIIDKEYQLKVEVIEKERQEAIKNAKQEDKEEINAAFDRRIGAEENAWMLRTEQNTQAREAALYKERLDKYQQFVEEYVRIERERQARIDELRKQAQEGNLTADEYASRVVQSDNIALVEKTTLQAELGLTAEEVTSLISGVVTETVGMAIDTIRNQLPALETELNALRASGADPAKIAKLTGEIKVMKGALNDAKKTTTQVSDASENTAKESKGDWKTVAQSLSVVNGALDEVMDTFGDMMSESGKTAISVMQTTLSATTGIIQAITTTSLTATGAIKAAESASVILAIISAAVQVIMAITNAIMKNSSAQAMYEKSMQDYENKLKELEYEQKRFEFELSKKAGVEYWREYVKGVDNAKKKLELLNKQAAEQKKRLKEINEQQYRNALVHNEFGLKNEEELRQEAQDKVSKKEQEVMDSLSETNDAILEGEKELYEIQQKLLEEMATTNVEQFGETMAESIVEGFSDGMEGMKTAFDDTVDDLIKSMLTKRLAVQLTDQFKDAFDTLEGYTTENSAGGALITDSEMSKFLSQMENAKAGAMAIGEEYQKLFAEMGLLDDTIDAESKGFETMSQDTANELNGRFTALQISGANIEFKLGEQIELDKKALTLSQAINDNIELATQIATQQLQELRLISQNTSLLAETNIRLKAIQDHTSRI